MTHEPATDSPVAIPITGELDLHTFRPSDLGELIPAYLEACAARGLRDVRIIHGKGTGTLRRIVQSVLDTHPAVARYAQADANWGATVVELKPLAEPARRP